MAEVEPQSIKSRIAALNLEKVHAPTPGTRPTYSYDAVATAQKKPPPPPPAQRPPQLRHQTVNNPPIQDSLPASTHRIGNQPQIEQPAPRISPALPPRPPPRNPSQQSPALPPRKSSDRSVTRRESSESISTIASGVSTLSLGSVKTNGSNGSTLYQVRAPAYDPSKLPPLPPKKQEEPKSATRAAMTSKRSVVASRELPPQIKPSAPALPSRPSLPPRQPTNALERSPERPVPALPSRSATAVERKRAIVPPPQRPVRSALSLGFNNKTTVEPPPIPSSRPVPGVNGAPPPVPTSSRPNLDAIMASKPKPGAVAQCLICRNFSGPDSHAAKFPRQSLPSSDVGYLASLLCDPFPSATDKARAIFTWLHHNVDYDVANYRAGTIKPSTPEGTITSGLAVCEGYAGLFAALALKGGLECLVVSGASKGGSYAPMGPNDPLPPYKMTHAWNAVKIDNGVWKLIDACWGAGSVGCQNRGEGYKRHFKPHEFTASNIDFGMRHFPGDTSQQLREDGRTITYDEYARDDQGGRVMVYGDAQEEGLGSRTFQPVSANIKVHDPAGPSVVRFQFASVCEHWDNARHGKGKPLVMLLSIGGIDGRNSEYRPFDTNGQVWWLDVPRAELGCAGQKVNVYSVTKFCDRDARGLTYEEWNNKTAYSAAFGGIAMWSLV
ncbi:hypothetical protein E8E11_000746 [Didymella keratinophila]|nr:hypothetical protein E8E11_000746 [Didymella keratinophila]